MSGEKEKNVAKELKNSVKIEEAGPCRKKVSIEIPEETIAKTADEQYETLRKDAVLPGFRKGRAPRRLLEKRFGKETSEQIKLKLLAEASEAAIKDNEINMLRDPNIDYEKIELPDSGPLKFEFEVEVKPEFKLPKLEGIPVNKTKLEVTDEQVDSELQQLQKWSGMWAPKEDGKVELDDQVIANAVLKIEGVEEAEKLDNTEIFVRENGFVGSIPVQKLDELLVGAKAGDKKKSTVEVSKTYFKEEYRGKKVDIEIEIKDIKWLKPAEINGDFLKRFGADSEDDLREKMRDSLQGRLEQQVRADMSSQITKYMLDKTDFELPTNIVAEQAVSILQRQYTNLLRQGLPKEQIESQLEKLKTASEEQAKEQLKAFFIMDKVADELKIEVSEEEINGHIAQVAIQQGQRPERMREEMMRDGSLAQFSLQIREDKCIAKLLESAKITEVDAPKDVKKAKKPVKKAEEPVKEATKTVKKAAKKSEETEEKPKKTAKKAKSTTKKKTKE